MQLLETTNMNQIIYCLLTAVSKIKQHAQPSDVMQAPRHIIFYFFLFHFIVSIRWRCCCCCCCLWVAQIRWKTQKFRWMHNATFHRLCVPAWLLLCCCGWVRMTVTVFHNVFAPFEWTTWEPFMIYISRNVALLLSVTVLFRSERGKMQTSCLSNLSLGIHFKESIRFSFILLELSSWFGRFSFHLNDFLKRKKRKILE